MGRCLQWFDKRLWPLQEFLLPLVPRLVPSLLLTQLYVGTELIHIVALQTIPEAQRGAVIVVVIAGNRVCEAQHVSLCALVEEELSVQFYVCVLQRWCWFLHDNMPFPWPFHTTISVKQGNNHAGYQICSGGFKYFKGSICEGNVKRNLNLGPWDRIWNSLYQIQTMQPKDSTFLMVTES